MSAISSVPILIRRKLNIAYLSISWLPLYLRANPLRNFIDRIISHLDYSNNFNHIRRLAPIKESYTPIKESTRDSSIGKSWSKEFPSLYEKAPKPEERTCFSSTDRSCWPLKVGYLRSCVRCMLMIRRLASLGATGKITDFFFTALVTF